MAQPLASPASAAFDPLDTEPGVFPWAQLRREAEEVAREEPVLAPMLGELVLHAASPAEMLARVLVRRVCAGLADEADFRALVMQILCEQPALLAQAGDDLHATRTRDPACTTALHAVMNLKGFHALQMHRVAHHLWLQGREALAQWLANASARSLGVDIHPAARIGSRVMLDHGNGIVIGETAVVEDDVSILQNVTLGGTGKHHGDRHPKIGRGVMIGAGSKVLGNIRIGAMSKIAAGSVVLADVPPRCTVAGVPAAIVRQHETSFPATEMNQSI